MSFVRLRETSRSRCEREDSSNSAVFRGMSGSAVPFRSASRANAHRRIEQMWESRMSQGRRLGLARLMLLAAVAGCGGGGPGVPAPVSGTIGAAGGTVVGPSGSKVVIPAGALPRDTAIGIGQTDA